MSQAVIRLATSAFTAAAWPESSCPANLKPAAYPTFYATHFATVERDDTFYRAPEKVTIVRITAMANIHVSVPRISLRRSTMSPIEPAGSAKKKNGNAEAVWISAMYMGLLVNDVISHAAPTVCVNVP
jgi:hypothetical protein